MPRLLLSSALALLLLVSLTLKLQLGSATNFSAQYPGNEDIAAMLAKNQFAVTMPKPDTDPLWVSGERDKCHLRIANVSPQGWHRAAVEWKAGNDSASYSAGSVLYDQQPIVKPLMRHYFRRLERYMGINAPPVLIRAIIRSGECPDSMVSSAELAALSN